jgi:ABC-type Zn2+ transport system substrate-binding protein/surface adhesin
LSQQQQESQESQESQHLSIKISALKAFECIVSVAPIDLFSNKNIDQTKQLIQSISINLLNESNNNSNNSIINNDESSLVDTNNNNNHNHNHNHNDDNNNKKQWLLASARSIGSFLSTAIIDTSNNTTNNNDKQQIVSTIFHTPEIKEYLKNNILNELLKSIEQPSISTHVQKVRYDREVLSTT